MTKYLGITIAVLLLILAGSGLYIKSLRSDIALHKANAAAEAEGHKQCKKDKENANAVSDKYQKSITDLNNDLRRIRLRHANTVCVGIDNGTGGPETSTTGQINVSGNEGKGVSVDWLFDYAGRCEQLRLQVIGLQDLIHTYENN